MLFGFHLRHVRRVTSRITSRTATRITNRITTRPGSQPIGHKYLHERDWPPTVPRDARCSFSIGDRTLCVNHPRSPVGGPTARPADSRRASNTWVGPGSSGPRLDPRRCSARTFEQHGADVQNAKKSARSSHRFAISQACVGVGALTAIVIVIVIREACGVVETWVRPDRPSTGVSLFRATHAWRSSVLAGRRETGRLRCGRWRVLVRNHSCARGDQDQPSGEPTGVITSYPNHHWTRATSGGGALRARAIAVAIIARTPGLRRPAQSAVEALRRCGQRDGSSVQIDPIP